jgi:hypothetical protein
VLEIVPVPLLDEEEVLVDVIRVEFEIGVAKVRLVGPRDPVLVCEDVKAGNTRQLKSRFI